MVPINYVFICGNDKEDYITGAAAPPSKNDPKYYTWKLENSVVMSWLLNTMTNEIGENFMYYRMAKEIWESAKATYSNVDNT